MKLGLFHFQVLYNVLENIHYIYDEMELANTVLSKVAEALNAEGGSIFRIDANGGISVLAAYGAPIESLRKTKFEVGKGVVGWVAQYIQPLKVDNPKQDSRFLGMIDTNTGFKTRCIIAAPIMAKGRPVGVIEFLNRKDGIFAIPDLELISMVGREIGIAFENVRLIQKIDHERALQEAVFTSLSAGLLVIDQEGRILKMNPIARKILATQVAISEDNHPPFTEVLKMYPNLVAVVRSIADSAAPLVRREFNLEDGKPTIIGYSGVPIVREDGVRQGSAMLFQDITGRPR